MLDKFPCILPAVEFQLFIMAVFTASLNASLLDTSSDIITVASDEFSICLARSTTEPATCCGSLLLRSLVPTCRITWSSQSSSLGLR